jgi:hypothetical protein
MSSQPPSAPSTAGLVLFAILAGAVATFGLGYNFGLGNHVELLPHVERLLDPSFAAGDFSVDSSAEGPRQYFARLSAVLGRAVGLPAAFLLMTLLQNAGTALVTALAARRMFPKAPLAPILAVLLVLAVEGLRLGEAGFLRLPTAVAFSVATPLALAAFWWGLTGRPGAALAAAAPATLIHPLVGLEMAGLGLAAALFERLRKRATLSGAFRAGAALAVLAGFGALVWLRGGAPRTLSSRAFIDIYVRFRAPHHLWPASFPAADWIVAAAFLAIALVLALRWARREPSEAALASRILAVLVLVVLAMAAGWVFVQAVPIRSAAILQTFRLTAVLKWLGYLLLAGAVGGSRFWVKPGRERRLSLSLAVGSLIILIAASIGRMGEASLPTRLQGLTLACLGFLAAAWLGTTGKKFGRLAAVGIAAVFVAVVAAPAGAKLIVAGSLLEKARPVFTLEQGRQREDAAAVFCRDILPKDAVVLTPPLLGRFRLVSRRALPADFKFMPTSDEALVEWRRRLEECYGPVIGSGFAAARAMDSRYHEIDEARLLRLRDLYGIGYALLYAEMPCNFSVLYKDKFFKIVALPRAR